MDRQRFAIVRAAGLLALALLLGGCGLGGPLLLPVVGSAGEVNGQWDDLDVYLVDPTGKAPAVRLTDTPELMETDPDLNRARSRVVYVAREVMNDGMSLLNRKAPPTPSRLVVCNTDGTERQVIYESETMCFTPIWSHDGKRIAFVEAENGWKLQLKLINADGSGLETLGYGSSPSWRRDGLALLYSSQDSIGDTRGALQLRELETGVIHDLGLSGTGYTNLRGGVSIAYAAPGYAQRNETIWLLDANGLKHRLTAPGENEHDRFPVFFDSAGDLIFTRYNDDIGLYELMRIHRNTDDRVAEPIAQPTTQCFTRGGLWIAQRYPR